MEVAVLISAVADPKWPLPPNPTLAALQAHAASHATLSPFDEAALELALALRDADPAVRITALVAADEGLTRRVAGWRPDAIHRLDLQEVPRWDGGAFAQALAAALHALAGQPALVLAGRECGDFDDGSVPASLALACGLDYFPLVLAVRRAEPGWSALRQGPGGLERVALPAKAALLSVTNDPGNRLRHPLMKNVALAKKAQFAVWRAPAGAATGLQLAGLQPAAAPVRTQACQWLEGTPEQKARALAQVLAEAVPG